MTRTLTAHIRLYRLHRHRYTSRFSEALWCAANRHQSVLRAWRCKAPDEAAEHKREMRRLIGIARDARIAGSRFEWRV